MRFASLAVALGLFVSGSALAQKYQHGMRRPGAVRPQKPQKASQAAVVRTPPAAAAPAAADRIEQLRRLSPSERGIALASVPADKRTEIESRLSELDRMSSADRQKLLDRYKRFQALSDDQKAKVRQLAKQFQVLPEARRAAVKSEMDHLRTVPENDRESQLNSSEVRHNFSSPEREILREGTTYFPEQQF